MLPRSFGTHSFSQPLRHLFETATDCLLHTLLAERTPNLLQPFQRLKVSISGGINACQLIEWTAFRYQPLQGLKTTFLRCPTTSIRYPIRKAILLHPLHRLKQAVFSRRESIIGTPRTSIVLPPFQQLEVPGSHDLRSTRGVQRTPLFSQPLQQLNIPVGYGQDTTISIPWTASLSQPLHDLQVLNSAIKCD